MRCVAIAALVMSFMALSSVVSAQTQSEIWQEMSVPSKLAYIRGFQNGIVIAEADRVARDVSLSNQCGTVAPIMTKALSAVMSPDNEASLVRGVDAVYSDNRNESFSMKAALTIAALEIGGAAPELIELMKVKCREGNLERPGSDYMATVLVMWEKTLRQAVAD